MHDSADSVKQGVLFKRGEGGFLKRKTWKRRYFQLCDAELRYYDTLNGVEKGKVLLSTDDFVEIMPKDCPKTGDSASTQWRLALHTPTRRFLLSASTEFDMYRWAEAIARAVETSPRKPSMHTTSPPSRMRATM
ncbi:hypothetical protein H310_14188 [Aphanomyces invadans]|uniref:PH domain-containing protein n=1 Tax=Aphanomyces invadans TaxID=157072 RepID=A0A024TCV1_9STRA|nr:hypothetical protein H310_14188 [Aphanomyces invadans]ETV91187.1 hypothetical protein H310_14188 [Aphanomyces invadans]RHY28718.1 hypothetical protein DYB32_005755 [Aphanomyces invadans]|eukprot:XP_008880218.1 hypothetical protein H310_14188 [Aphanomyces invadans]